MEQNPNMGKQQKESLTPEEKILKAARLEFLEKGFDGTRMQQIAEKADINKALLHYYFRSKDKLFIAIFEAELKKLLPTLISVFNSDKPISQKIRDFFELHFGFLIENPMLPSFILTEVTRHSEKLDMFFKHFREMEVYSKFESLIAGSIKSGELKEIDPAQLLLSLLSLSVFPVLAGPLIQGVLNISDEKYTEILVERKKIIADFVIDSVIIEKR